jgi:hypothetical protein
MRKILEFNSKIKVFCSIDASTISDASSSRFFNVFEGNAQTSHVQQILLSIKWNQYEIAKTEMRSDWKKAMGTLPFHFAHSFFDIGLLLRLRMIFTIC